ncbi:hypothetical protein BLNAU_22680 [Blattamonas nauphoetae]|uniref:PABC domain-containing protein n=1 Tax=Blattamonas nauphoetae TaxID=2049346 RepID=A0ABQ9WSD9_9EUKA|nr:hypothetical protein BLNAU_22680 [Blattamonas nauphoetae]
MSSSDLFIKRVPASIKKEIITSAIEAKTGRDTVKDLSSTPVRTVSPNQPQLLNYRVTLDSRENLEAIASNSTIIIDGNEYPVDVYKSKEELAKSLMIVNVEISDLTPNAEQFLLKEYVNNHSISKVSLMTDRKPLILHFKKNEGVDDFVSTNHGRIVDGRQITVKRSEIQSVRGHDSADGKPECTLFVQGFPPDTSAIQLYFHLIDYQPTSVSLTSNPAKGTLYAYVSLPSQDHVMGAVNDERLLVFRNNIPSLTLKPFESAFSRKNRSNQARHSQQPYPPQQQYPQQIPPPQYPPQAMPGYPPPGYPSPLPYQNPEMGMYADPMMLAQQQQLQYQQMYPQQPLYPDPNMAYYQGYPPQGQYPMQPISPTQPQMPMQMIQPQPYGYDPQQQFQQPMPMVQMPQQGYPPQQGLIPNQQIPFVQPQSQMVAQPQYPPQQFQQPPPTQQYQQSPPMQQPKQTSHRSNHPKPNLPQFDMSSLVGDEESRKQIIGNHIYTCIEPMYGEEFASKITGLILMLEYQHLVKIVESPDLLMQKIEEGYSLIKKSPS